MKFRASVDGKDYLVDVQPGSKPGTFVVTAGDRERQLDLETVAGGWLYSLLVDGRSVEVVSGPGLIEINGQAYAVEVERDLGFGRSRAAASDVVELKAPIPGLVVAVHAQPGDEVREGQPLIVLEAMKMQMELKSPRAGRVAQVSTEPGQEVNQGQRLLVVGD